MMSVIVAILFVVFMRDNKTCTFRRCAGWVKVRSVSISRSHYHLELWLTRSPKPSSLRAGVRFHSRNAAKNHEDGQITESQEDLLHALRLPSIDFLSKATEVIFLNWPCVGRQLFDKEDVKQISEIWIL